MITCYSPHHALHHGKLEMFRGELVPCFEVPARADFVLEELVRRGLGPVQQPPQPKRGQATALAASALATIHTPRYLDFLANAWDEWIALDPASAGKDAFPSLWPVHHGNGTQAIFYDRPGVLFSSIPGGYAVAELGVNAVNVLEGFEQQGT